MNLATGVDLIEIERIRDTIARSGESFLQRIYTAAELELCRGDKKIYGTRTSADERGEKREKSACIRVHPRPEESTPTENRSIYFSLASLAARFAAKEAVAKALGCGIGQVSWQEIEILRDDANAPVLHLHGAAQALADKIGLTTWSLSLSHTETHAIAFVAAIGEV